MCVSFRDPLQPIDAMARMTMTRIAAPTRAAAVGLSPKMRVDSPPVRGEAAPPSSRRSLLTSTLTSGFDDEGPGAFTVVSLLELSMLVDGDGGAGLGLVCGVDGVERGAGLVD